ncbi:MAG TPA: hypothetical protein DCW42_02870 [Bacteroidetes bacterium]|nr:hypothetical protein [Bacteroidota bacterium]
MKKIFFGFIILSVLFSGGCNLDSPVNGHFNLPTGLLTSGGSFNDTTNISALIIVQGISGYDSRESIIESGYAMTYFCNSDDFIDVSSVAVNDNQLLKIDDLTGNYGGAIEYPKTDPRNIMWYAMGYLGGNLIDTFQVVEPMTLTNINYLDRINKNQGYLINYTGSNGGILYVKISYGPRFASYPDSVLSGIETIAFQVPDNGNFTITPEILSTLPSDQYYDLSIEHRSYSTEPYNGHYIGKCSLFRTFTSFYLISNSN